MKKVIALLSTMAVILSAVSCSKDDNSSAQTSRPEKKIQKKIGIAMPSEFLERWTHDGESLKAQFEAEGYAVDLKYSGNDEEKQNKDISELIAEKVDMLIIAAVDGEKLSDTLQEAKSLEIPVIAYDRLIMNTNAVSYYVSFDNYSVGKQQGEYVCDTLDLDNTSGPYNIEFVAGDAGDNNAKFFYKGAYEFLKPYIESGKLVIPSGMDTFEQVATQGWSSDVACKNMKETLSSYYSDGTVLDVALCANDSTALGVEQAIDSDYEGDNVPIITGQDGDIANLKNIVDGKQSMTVYKNVSYEAGAAVIVTKTILSGKEPDAGLLKQIPTSANFDTGTYDNGVKTVPAYLLVPSVITKDNLDELVNTGLYKWDSNKKYLESASSETSSEN